MEVFTVAVNHPDWHLTQRTESEEESHEPEVGEPAQSSQLKFLSWQENKRDQKTQLVDF